MFTSYSLFWEGVKHNVIWLAFFVFIATPIGIFFAVLLDREMRGTRIYQSIFYIPVVLSLAVVGYIWEIQYTSQGFINSLLGHTVVRHRDRLPRQPEPQPVGRPHRRELAARRLRPRPLPGRPEERGPDPARGRLDRRRERAPDVLPRRLPGHEADQHRGHRHHGHRVLRAFDIVYVINRGKNGLELLSTLITNNSISEASLVGFGSAIAVVLLVISLGPIVFYLTRAFKGGPE